MSTAARRPLIVGNWKMNLNHFEAIAMVQKIAFSLNESQLEAVETVVLPPFVDLRSVQTMVDAENLNIKYGAQDVSAYPSGAYTGDISASMLAKLGCTYVAVGHSERRRNHAETNELVAAKAKAALHANITPIVCIGESLEDRESGRHEEACREMLQNSLQGIKGDALADVIVTYEPVWAVGTGKIASAEDAHEMCGSLRGLISELYGASIAATVRFLYGGSVTPANISLIMSEKLNGPEMSHIDGALIGGASLKAEDFCQIVRFPEYSN